MPREEVHSQRCPICERSGVNKPIERGKDYVIYRCSYCGGDFAQTALSIDYREEYRRNETPAQAWRKLSVMWSPEGRLREAELESKSSLVFEFLKASSAKGKLLDVGCGVGVFAKLAEGLGFEVYALDPAEEAIGYAKENFELTNTVTGTIDDIPSTWRDFDFITAIHVLEHLDEPRQLVKRVYELLARGAYFVMSTPNRNRLTVKLRRRESRDYPPNHLTRWSKETLNFFLNDLGFVKVAIKIGGMNRFVLASLLLPERFNAKIAAEKTNVSVEPRSAKGGFFYSPIWKFVQRGGDGAGFLLQKLLGSGYGGDLAAFAQKPPVS